MTALSLVGFVPRVGSRNLYATGVHRCGNDSKDDYSRSQLLGEEIFLSVLPGYPEGCHALYGRAGDKEERGESVEMAGHERDHEKNLLFRG